MERTRRLGDDRGLLLVEDEGTLIRAGGCVGVVSDRCIVLRMKGGKWKDYVGCQLENDFLTSEEAERDA